MARISVVIPLYNKAPHIKRAIDSVLAQTEQDFEIIVVNDASTDGGDKIVASITDHRIRLFHRDNPGPGGHAARNKGIQESATDFIAFLDADDAYMPEFLESVIELRRKYPSAGAYATAYEMVQENGTIKRNKYYEVPDRQRVGIIRNYFKSALGPQPVCSSAVAVKKEVFEKVGCFPEGEPLGGDLDMWARIAIEYPIAFNAKVCSQYYLNAINRIVKTVKSPEKYRFDVKAKDYGSILSNKGMREEHIYFDEFINKYRLKYGLSLILEGQKAKALAYLLRLRTHFYLFKKISYLISALLPTKILHYMLAIRNRNG